MINWPASSIGRLSMWLLIALLLLIEPCATRANEPTLAELEFFERNIRPIFVERCYECHSGSETNGGLRLDSSTAWLKGGDSGPAIVAGKPDDSLLIKAIRYGGDIEMPPTGKLSGEKIGLIEKWVAQGAPAPRESSANPKTEVIDLDVGRKFWAYQPVKNWPIPANTVYSSAPTILDRIVLARLESAGLQPQPEAEPTVLVRRLYFDLIGLPPTPEEIDRFLNDPSPNAYEMLVDRLLASPHFSERWGRHWLDVVRFAESLSLRGFVLPEAWRYRDYVIESFCDDRPYDEFLKHQIAGDLFQADSIEAQQRQLTATTFLTLGNSNLEEQDKRQLEMDVVDEQLDVLGKAMLGQTIGCARCHDHKFDPIPTRDYYALAGIFRNVQVLEHDNVSKWIEVPLPLSADKEAQLQAEESAIVAFERRIDDTRQQLGKLAPSQTQDQSNPAIVAPADLPGIVVDDEQAKKVGEWKRSQYTARYIGHGYIHDLDQNKGENTLTFVPELRHDGRYEVRLAYTPGSNRSDRVPITVFSADGEKTVHVDMRQAPPLDGRWISLGNYQCESAGQNFVLVANEGTQGHVIADAVQYISLDIRSTEKSHDATQAAPTEELRELASLRRQLKQLEEELNARKKAAFQRPMVMTVRERKEISDAPVHVRGSVHTLGEVVPRGFLQVISLNASTPPASQSGRLQLAEWIVASENPLTSRVMVNRVWHWLIGEGLVRTVDNFGTTGEPPSHPELLDHLASRFIEQGWSIKQLIRYIVLSATYRRSSSESEIGLRIDPENRLLWRANRKRLEAECLRDAMLLVAGTLSLNSGGPTLPVGLVADFDYVDRDPHRSVYVPVLRNAMPQLFEVFDFPDSSIVVGRRNCSTVATQALFMMNDPFVREQAQAAARRVLAERLENDEQAIIAAFRQTLGRKPTPPELQLARRITTPTGQESRELAWTNLYQILFASLDFRYRD